MDYRLRARLASPAALALLAVAAGVANAVALLGWGPIDPTNTAWLFGDTSTYYTGWSLYRHDAHLRFPLTWTDRIGYPFGASLALFDAIPLVAVVLRPLSPILPEPFQYLGLYVILSCALQAYFGLRLCRRLFPSDRIFALLGSLFFLIAPPFTERAFGHTALMSQWTILAALDSYFRDPAETPVRWLRRLWIVVAIAAGLNPYIAVMCLLVALTAVLRLALERRCRWIEIVVLAAATVAIFVASSALFGVLVGGTDTYQAPGYGQFSLNLNALVNPMQYGSMLLPPLRLMHPYQFDGYNYLGLGMIALLVLGFARRPESVLWLRERRLVPLIVLVIVSTALAASTTVSFGSSTLFTIPLPTQLATVVAGFRASGRLFWPAYYVIVAAALALTCRAWGASLRIVVLVVLFAVQFADVTPLRAAVRKTMDMRFESPLTSPAWELGSRYDNLILIPAHQCDPYTGGAGGVNGYVWFGKLAAAERMRTNSYYAARYGSSELRFHCVERLRRELAGELDPRSAYVVSDGVRTIWRLGGMRSHRCEVADGFNLCTPATADEAEREAAAVPQAAAYTVGDVLNFRLRKSVRPYLVFGWSPAEPNGAWTLGPLALIRLGLDPSADRSRGLILEVEAQPSAEPGDSRIDVDVAVNGQAVDRWTFESASIVRRQARIPPQAASRRADLDIELRVPNPTSPHSGFRGIKVSSLTVKHE
jgi:hypothetical protein